jgi:ribosome-binding factor A
MVDHARARKMADRIKEIVARKLDRGIKDPRLGFVTVTDVRVTGDLQHASIFYTVYGTDEERADTAAALKSATGMLRSEVGRTSPRASRRRSSSSSTASRRTRPRSTPSSRRRAAATRTCRRRRRPASTRATRTRTSSPA